MVQLDSVDEIVFPLKEETILDVAAVLELLKALAHPLRLQIIQLLDELGPAGMADLRLHLECSRSDLTRQIDVLEHAGVVRRFAAGNGVRVHLTQAGLPAKLASL